MVSSRKAFTALVLGFFLSGCDPLLSVMVKEATHELGVPVTTTADDKDQCARSQMGLFLREYKKWPASRRDRFREKLAVYQGVVIAPTQFTQTRVGDLIQISLMTNDCPAKKKQNPDKNKYCSEFPIKSRVLTRPLEIDGPEPRTQVEREQVITVTAQAQDDQARLYDYETKEQWVFDSIYTPIHPKLGSEYAPLKYSAITPRVRCGARVALRQVLDH